MTTTTKLIGTILTAAALVGFSGAGAAMAASSTERPTTDTAVVTTTSSTFEFKVTNFGDRDLVVSNVFATDGSGHKTRVGPFLPGDEYAAVGSVVEGHGSLTFKVSRTFLGNHGLSVVLYDPNNTRDKVQVWMVAGTFWPSSDATTTFGAVQCYGDYIVIAS
jgi:hypothetical protein